MDSSDFSCDFPVGSIVYFLHNKTERVLPAQVTEKIVRTSISGSRATYIIAVQSKEGTKNIEVDPEEVQVCQTPDEMKSFMVKRATTAISHLVDIAVQASSIFSDVVTQSQDDPDSPGDNDIDPLWHTPAADRPLRNKKKGKNTQDKEYTTVDLGDGTKARLKM